MIIVWWYMIMICSFAWSQGFGYLVINILCTREDSTITVNCFIAGYRSASICTSTSSSPVSSPSTSGASCFPCHDGPGATHSGSSPLPGPGGKTVSSDMSPPSISSPASVQDSPLLKFPLSPVSQNRIKLSSGSEAKVRLPLMHTHMSRLPQNKFQKYFVFLRESKIRFIA
jgi:hypothetical protein